MTVRAKTLIKDKFWIVEEHGQKLGTLQKKDDNGWLFLSKKDHRQIFHTQESLFTKFGFNGLPLDSVAVSKKTCQAAGTADGIIEASIL